MMETGKPEEMTRAKRGIINTRVCAEASCGAPATAKALSVFRDLPEEMTDNEALVLMLSVHCTADVVGLSIDPPMTGPMVRKIVMKYRPYYERLRESANAVLRNILEDSMMIALGRVRSALCRVPIVNAGAARCVMSVLLDLRKLASELPKEQEFSTTPATADRFESLQKKIQLNLESIKENEDAVEDTEAEERAQESDVPVGCSGAVHDQA